MSDEAPNIVLEHLRAIRASQEAVREDIREIKGPPHRSPCQGSIFAAAIRRPASSRASSIVSLMSHRRSQVSQISGGCPSTPRVTSTSSVLSSMSSFIVPILGDILRGW